VAGTDVPRNNATGGATKVTYIDPPTQRLWDAAYETEEAHRLLDELCPRMDGDGELLSLAARIAMALDPGEPDA
jgi:hypothetical protein